MSQAIERKDLSAAAFLFALAGGDPETQRRRREHEDALLALVTREGERDPAILVGMLGRELGACRRSRLR